MINKLQSPKFEITTIEPVYQRNYKKGYIGFTYTNNHVIAKGIASQSHETMRFSADTSELLTNSWQVRGNS